MLPSIGQLYDDPSVANALRAAVERGVNVTIAVHNYMAQAVKELGREGKIKIVYTPQMSEVDMLTISGSQHKALFSAGKSYSIAENPEVVNKLEASGRRMEHYPVPADKVEGLADMLLKGTDTEGILAFLQGDTHG